MCIASTCDYIHTYSICTYVHTFNDRKGVESNTKTLVAKQLGTVVLQVPFSMEGTINSGPTKVDIYIRTYI